MHLLLFVAAFVFSQLLPSSASSEEEIQRTLSVIKPDAVAAQHIGEIISRFENYGLRIAAIKMVHLNREEAECFYSVHKEKPFYSELVDHMSSGSIIAMVLEGEDAILRNREIMGSTDPSKAAPGTIRADFAQSFTQNAVHGSDSPQNAEIEINFFFWPEEIY